MFLIDTNVVSEPTRARPDDKVLAWLANTPVGSTAVSVVTTAEIFWGLARAQHETKRAHLRHWIADVFEPQYANRQIELSLPVLQRWFALADATGRAGAPRRHRDALIAATALAGALTVVTRNWHDFQYTGVTVFDPWTGQTHQMDTP